MHIEIYPSLSIASNLHFDSFYDLKHRMRLTSYNLGNLQYGPFSPRVIEAPHHDLDQGGKFHGRIQALVRDSERYTEKLGPPLYAAPFINSIQSCR